MEFYRFDSPQFHPEAYIFMKIFSLIKETPKGWWIKQDPKIYFKNKWVPHIPSDRERWVSKTSIKRFAYPTIKEAMISFRKRRETQIKIYEDKLTKAKRELREAIRRINEIEENEENE